MKGSSSCNAQQHTQAAGAVQRIAAAKASHEALAVLLGAQIATQWDLGSERAAVSSH